MILILSCFCSWAASRLRRDRAIRCKSVRAKCCPLRAFCYYRLPRLARIFGLVSKWIFSRLRVAKMLTSILTQHCKNMTYRVKHKLLSYFIAAVWIANGLFCKVLNLVPRHGQIVARILGDDYSRPLTLLIGLSEIGMAMWIISGIRTRLNAVIQIVVIAIMNTLEFALVPDLLLWGKANAVFAFMFILLIYYNEFYLNKRLVQQP